MRIYRFEISLRFIPPRGSRPLCILPILARILGLLFVSFWLMGSVNPGKNDLDVLEKGTILALKCSPKGGEIGLIVSVNGVPSLYVLSISERKISKIVEDVSASFLWTKDGKGIIYAKRWQQKVYLYDMKNRSSKLLLTNARNFTISPDGLKSAYLPRAKPVKKSYGIIVVDSKTGKSRRFLKDRLVLDYSWSPDSRYIAAIDAGSSDETLLKEFFPWREVTLLDVERGVEKIIAKKAVPTYSATPLFITSTKLLYPFVEVIGKPVAPPTEIEPVQAIVELKTYDVSTGKEDILYKRASPSISPPHLLLLSPDRKTLIISLPFETHCVAQFYDLAKRKVMKEINTDYQFAPIDWLPGGKEAIFVWENRLWIYSLPKKEEKPL